VPIVLVAERELEILAAETLAREIVPVAALEQEIWVEQTVRAAELAVEI